MWPERPRRCCSPALNNQFWSPGLNKPIATLPVMIYRRTRSRLTRTGTARHGPRDWYCSVWYWSKYRCPPDSIERNFRPREGNMIRLMTQSRILQIKLQLRIPAERRPTSRHPRARLRLRCREPEFFYGTFQALHDIKVDIPEKRITALIGPSGCGKSRSCARSTASTKRFATPAQRARSRSTARTFTTVDVTSLRRRVGMVFQRPNPFPEVDLRQRGVRHAHQRMKGKRIPARQGGTQPQTRGPVGRSEG